MSDMKSSRITIRVPKALGDRLQHRSRAKGKTPSEIVRVALETYLGNGDAVPSAFEVAQSAGLIGCVTDTPKDLSTNRRHFDGFGKQK
jgi:predicted DNA-binding protein